mgnify:CR=1 FL=1
MTTYREATEQTEYLNKNVEVRENLQAALKSQSEALNRPELKEKVKTAEQIDQMNPEEQQELAEHLGTSVEGLDAKIKSNPAYQQAGTSVSQLLSFLQTKQALAYNGMDQDPFVDDFAQIQTDLSLPNPPISNAYEAT